MKIMKKEDLVAKGLSEEHAQIAVEAWNEAIKEYISKERFGRSNWLIFFRIITIKM